MSAVELNTVNLNAGAATRLSAAVSRPFTEPVPTVVSIASSTSLSLQYAFQRATTDAESPPNVSYAHLV